MAHPDYIREKAIQMRVERRFSIDEIAERLALSKTTVYYWVGVLTVSVGDTYLRARLQAWIDAIHDAWDLDWHDHAGRGAVW